MLVLEEQAGGLDPPRSARVRASFTCGRPSIVGQRDCARHRRMFCEHTVCRVRMKCRSAALNTVLRSPWHPCTPVIGIYCYI